MIGSSTGGYPACWQSSRSDGQEAALYRSGQRRPETLSTGQTGFPQHAQRGPLLHAGLGRYRTLFIDSLIHWFIDSLIDWLIDSMLLECRLCPGCFFVSSCATTPTKSRSCFTRPRRVCPHRITSIESRQLVFRFIQSLRSSASDNWSNSIRSNWFSSLHLLILSNPDHSNCYTNWIRKRKRQNKRKQSNPTMTYDTGMETIVIWLFLVLSSSPQILSLLVDWLLPGPFDRHRIVGILQSCPARAVVSRAIYSFASTRYGLP